jgi:hypothetical protein
LDVVCALSISEAHEYITYGSGSQMQDITRTNGYRSLLGFVALSFFPGFAKSMSASITEMHV